MAWGILRKDKETEVVVRHRRGGCRHSTRRALQDDFDVGATVLGTGMHGAVHLATSRSDGQTYAVKSFRKAELSARSLLEMRSEAEIYLSLDHPHIARLDTVYESSSELHLVMEHLAGGELYERLSRQAPYSEEKAAAAVRQMLLAVAYLHAKDVVHRDIKLENFLYEADDGDHLKLIDFGLSVVAGEGVRMSQVCGSMHYVAPEVLARSYTSKADLWSLGVLTHMLLTGRSPFHGPESQVRRKIMSGDFPWSVRFHQLSPAAKDFLQSLLAHDCTKRLNAQQALEHRWISQWRHANVPCVSTGVISNLQLFAQTSKFRREVSSLIAWSLPAEDCSKFRDQFLAIDKENTGTIDMKGFKTVLGSKSRIRGEEAEAIFRSLDTDGSGRIEYSEFLAAMFLGKVAGQEKMLRKAFRRFDADGDGMIDETELRSVLGNSFMDSEGEDLVSETKTGDGLDYEEFQAYFKANPSNVQADETDVSSSGSGSEKLPLKAAQERRRRRRSSLGRAARPLVLQRSWDSDSGSCLVCGMTAGKPGKFLELLKKALNLWCHA